MAKRRARIEARVSKLKRKQASSTVGGSPLEGAEAVVAPPAASHVRKLQKRVRFLDRVKTSALAAKAAVFKRKRKTQGISLGALEDALPQLESFLPTSSKAKSAPQFLPRASGVVHKRKRIKRFAAETTRFAAVLSNSMFQDDPIAAVTNHVLAQLPKPPAVVKDVRHGRSKKKTAN